MTGLIARLREDARRSPRRLLFAERDERVLSAAATLARERLADVTLVGAADELSGAARSAGVWIDGLARLDSADPALIESTRAALIAVRGDRLAPAELDRAARDPLFQAATRVREGLADCLVAGAERTSADVLRAALWLIGLDARCSRVSSFFVMVVPARDGQPERVLLFADCGVVPDPDVQQLAEIGTLAADHFARLTGGTPRVAFLSFSTRGSADHPRVEKVRRATEIARAARPDLVLDGELQADVALDPGVAERKAPGGAVAGAANVLVFPDLDAGNIGYKLVQRLGGAEAYGPILMGLRRQANDLSRGCTAEEVVNVALIACVLAQRASTPPR